MESSSGSNVFALLAVFTISVFVLLLLRHFLPLRSTPAFLLVPIFFALALPISIILLVPIDLASTSRNKDEASRGIWLPHGVLLVAWRIMYWLTFCLTWFILPLLGEYIDSGYRTPRDRLLYSLRSNGRYQLIALGCGVAGLIYIILQNGFKGTSIKALVMALAYCWGLILAIYLMGHGLVAVPRRLFRNADVAGRLRRLQAHAPKVHDRLTTAIAELEDLEAQVILLGQRKHGISRDHQEWIEELADLCNLPEARPASSVHSAGATIPAVITDRYLAEVSRKLNRTRHKRIRFIDTWDRLVRQAHELQAIIDAAPTKRLDFGKPSPHASFLERLTLLTPYTRWVLYARIIPGLRLMYGTIFALASIFVVWSELIKFAVPRLSMISLTVVTYPGEDAEVNFVGQLFSSLWLLYMCTATLASFQDVKIWGNRALVRRNTYGESAAWYSGQIAKLTVPLAYNFVTFLPEGIHKKTTFYQFLGSLIDLTPLGQGFDYFFPMFILLPVCATLFNLYGRARNIFNFDIVEDDDEETPPGFGGGGWREGRALIEADSQRHSHPALGEGQTSPRNSGYSTPTGLRSQPSQAQDSPANLIAGRQKPVRSTTGERQAQRLADATRAAEEEDENIFQGFAHRVRNTFDTVDRPEWLSDLGRRPKWMGGVDGNTESSGRADSGRGMGRWFGGRPADGQVRL